MLEWGNYLHALERCEKSLIPEEFTGSCAPLLQLVDAVAATDENQDAAKVDWKPVSCVKGHRLGANRFGSHDAEETDDKIPLL